MKNLIAIVALAGLVFSGVAQAQSTDSSAQPTTRTVEDGGTGPYKAIAQRANP